MHFPVLFLLLTFQQLQLLSQFRLFRVRSNLRYVGSCIWWCRYKIWLVPDEPDSSAVVVPGETGRPR